MATWRNGIALDLTIERSKIRLPIWHHYVVATLCKLLTPLSSRRLCNCNYDLMEGHGRTIQCAQCASAQEATPHRRPHHKANVSWSVWT